MQLYNTYDTFICFPTTNTLSVKVNPTEEELSKMLISHINRIGFNGTAPLPKEAKNAVENAKRPPKIVEY